MTRYRQTKQMSGEEARGTTVLPEKDFELLSEITNVEVIARGSGIRIRQYLNKTYGYGRWRKMKGEAWIQLKNSGEIQYAELHWFEAHGIGQHDMKRKRKLRGK